MNENRIRNGPTADESGLDVDFAVGEDKAVGAGLKVNPDVISGLKAGVAGREGAEARAGAELGEADDIHGSAAEGIGLPAAGEKESVRLARNLEAGHDSSKAIFTPLPMGVPR